MNSIINYVKTKENLEVILKKINEIYEDKITKEKTKNIILMNMTIISFFILKLEQYINNNEIMEDEIYFEITNLLNEINNFVK